jgi:TP901 family phage tail tape measure protein
VNKLLKLDPSNTTLLAQKHNLLQKEIEETNNKLKVLKEANKKAGESVKNYDAWEKAYEPIRQEMEKTKNSISELKKKMKELEDVGDIDTEEYKKLQSELKESNSHLKELKKQAKETSDEFGNPISTSQYEALQREIVETEQHLKTLKNTAGSGSAALEEVSAVTGKVGSKMKSAGQAIMPASAAMAGLGAVSVNTANDFESAMSQAAGALNMPMSQMSELRDLAIETGQETIFSAKESGQAITELAKGGLTEADIKTGALKATMDLAASSGMDLGNAANVVVQAMGAFGLSAEESALAANALAGAAASSSTDVEPLTQGLAQVSAQAYNAGWSMQETTAVLGKFADAGIVGSDAGTSLKTMLQKLAAPTDKAAEMITNLGIQTRDSSENLLGASDMAQELQNKLGSLSSAQRDAALQTIFGSDATRAATVLMNSGSEGLASYIKATNDQEAAQRLANSQMGEGSLAIEEMKGSLETAAITIGSKLAPVITKVAEFITDLVNKFSALPEGVQTAIVVIGAIIAVLGPLLMIIGQVAMGISSISLAFSKMSALGGLISKLVTTVSKMLKGLFVVIQGHPVIAIITAIVAAIILLYTKCEWFRDAVHSVISAICSFFTETIPKAWDSLVEKFQAIPEWWAGIWQQVKDFFIQTWQTIMENPIVVAIVSTIQALFRNMVTTIQGIWSGLVSIASGAWELLKNTILGPVLLLIDLVTGNFEQLKLDAQNIWNNIKEAANQIWSGIKEVVASLVDGLVTRAQILLQGFRDVISQIWNNIKQTASQVWESIKSFVVNTANNLKESAINTFKNLVSGIKNILSNLGEVVKNGFQSAIDFITSLPGKALEWGKDFIQGLIDGIKSMISKVTDAVEGVAKKIRSFLHFSRPDEGPLREYETWMPDMMNGLAKGIYSNMPVLEKAVSAVSKTMSGDLSRGLSMNPQIAYAANQSVNVNNDVTVMVGNEQFKGYIVKTASNGISNMQKRYTSARGGKYV